MLRSIQGLHGSIIQAVDGEIGNVDEFYFDDERWTVRYLVADSGGWLSGRKVLISPVALRESDWERHLLRVDLTREQVENSPDVDTARPVSRQWEANYFDYFGWPYYWGGLGMWGWGWFPGVLAVPPVIHPERTREEAAVEARKEADPHLRSTRAVTDYRIQTLDGDLGHVDDFILDDETWAIRYLAVDTSNWWRGKKVLVAPPWIKEVSWPARSVTVDMTREQLRDAPEWDSSSPISRAYEERLHQYHGRPGYWEAERRETRAA